MKKILTSFVACTVFILGSFVVASAATSTPTVTAVGVATGSTLQIVNNLNIGNISSGTATSCQPFITAYHKIGMQGVEVAKLQLFLNQVNGARLNGKGYFGLATQQEVKNFQFTYGIKPTGYQHVLTTKMINDIYCGKVAKKTRKVFVASVMTKSATQMTTPTVPSTKGVTGVDNSKTKNLVKEYEVPKNIKLTGSTTNPGLNATKTSFWENLNKDWNKIKENYKAYLLVFALVLALFWFLRKAATE